MIAAPPIANLLVIRSPNIDRAVTFYERMGLLFHRHSHGKGPEHYASDVGGFVFEIYPQKNADEITTSVRIGFNVNDVDCVVNLLREIYATIVTEPTDTEWGRRAVLKDFDGHTVELVTPHDRESSIAKCNGNATSTHDAEDAK
jgi:catechol 2,3-dioxygenase-like lactoylglutathione lyase family enzyme